MSDDPWAGWRAVDWNRRAWIRRIEDLVARYAAMREGPRPGLIVRHPTAFREAKSQPPEERADRSRRAEEELRRLKAGAPLPAVERTRRMLYGTADLGWRMRELRVLRRYRRRPDPRAAYDEAERADPLPSAPEAERAWFALAPSKRLAVAIALSEQRMNVRGLERWLFRRPTPSVELGPVTDFEAGPREVEIEGERYVVLRREGEWVAVDGVCPHRGGLLAEGSIEEGCIVCPIHFWKFSLSDGRAVVGRGQLQIHRVWVEGGRLYLHRSDG